MKKRHHKKSNLSLNAIGKRFMNRKYWIAGGLVLAAGFLGMMAAGTAAWLMMSQRPTHFNQARHSQRMAPPSRQAFGAPVGYSPYQGTSDTGWDNPAYGNSSYSDPVFPI